MKKLFKKFLYFFLIILVIAITWNIQLIGYGLSQLNGQLHIIINAQPVAKVLNDSSLDSTYRQKLLLISEIRKFAIDSLGLNDIKNYTTFYDQHNEPLLWVVTGCKPFELQAKEWKFPVIGKVGYKGFFIEAKALHEADKIRAEGYETDIYSPAAWSTLGYFTDPILSGQLKRGPGRLSELIIHEMTHATVFIESNVDYNENLATFIGEEGAKRFLMAKYGSNSIEFKNYSYYLDDENLYAEYMMSGSKELNSLYHTLNNKMSFYDKSLVKYRFIAKLMVNLQTLPFHHPERYQFKFLKEPLPNNTFFMAYLRYRKKQDIFRSIFKSKYNQNISQFIIAAANKSRETEKLPF